MKEHILFSFAALWLSFRHHQKGKPVNGYSGGVEFGFLMMVHHKHPS